MGTCPSARDDYEQEPVTRVRPRRDAVTEDAATQIVVPQCPWEPADTIVTRTLFDVTAQRQSLHDHERSRFDEGTARIDRHALAHARPSEPEAACVALPPPEPTGGFAAAPQLGRAQLEPPSAPRMVWSSSSAWPVPTTATPGGGARALPRARGRAGKCAAASLLMVAGLLAVAGGLWHHPSARAQAIVGLERAKAQLLVLEGAFRGPMRSVLPR